MATTGYITSSDGQQTPFDHTNNVALFYGPGDKWWGAFVSSTDADVYLYENDEATPASPGGTGGWSKAAKNGGGNVVIDTRASARPTLYYDSANSKLHIVIMHGTTEYYARYGYNSGTNDWTAEVTTENIGTSNNTLLALVVDSNGIPWVAYPAGTSAAYTLHTRYRDTDNVWKQGGDIEATSGGPASGDLRISNGFAWSDGGTASIGFVYTWSVAGVGYHKFAYRADSTAKATALSVETIESGISVDNHASAAAALFSGDTTSTIIAAFKQTSGSYKTHRRNPSGTWGNHTLTGSLTRVKLAIDETNAEVYAIAANDQTTPVRVVYNKADATTTLSWGSQVTVLEDDGVIAFGTDVAVPDRPVNSTSDLAIAGISGGETWWNAIDIAGDAGGSGDSQRWFTRQYGKINGTLSVNHSNLNSRNY